MMLRHVRTISAGKDPGSWLDDVVYAFSESLESVSVSLNPSIFLGHGRVPYPRPLAFQEHWRLPCLRKLELRNDRGVVNDIKLLSNSPLLEELTLIELVHRVILYDEDAIKPQEPFHMPKLKELRLVGWAALVFHLTSLCSSPDESSSNAERQDKIHPDIATRQDLTRGCQDVDTNMLVDTPPKFYSEGTRNSEHPHSVGYSARPRPPAFVVKVTPTLGNRTRDADKD